MISTYIEIEQQTISKLINLKREMLDLIPSSVLSQWALALQVSFEGVGQSPTDQLQGFSEHHQAQSLMPFPDCQPHQADSLRIPANHRLVIRFKHWNIFHIKKSGNTRKYTWFLLYFPKSPWPSPEKEKKRINWWHNFGNGLYRI